MGSTACTEHQCLYLCFPYGPYGLYRASVPVPLLSLWAVWPVQSLSACTSAFPMGRTACTEPQCLYLCFPYGQYGLYRASVPVPLLSLWAVRPVQSLSACTSAFPMGSTACTEPQCLYRVYIYLGQFPSTYKPKISKRTVFVPPCLANRCKLHPYNKPNTVYSVVT